MPHTGLHFVRVASAEAAPDALDGATIVASSRQLGWDGVVAEMGSVADWEANDLTVAGHFIALNRDTEPLDIEDKGPHGFRRITMPPGSLWINPAGHSFTRRNPGVTRFGAVEVSVDRVRRALGHDIELRQCCGVADEPLAAVVRSLLVEASTNGSSGPLFAESLGVAIASRLARQFGWACDTTRRNEARGAIEGRLKLVLEKIEDTLGSAITVDDLATVAGLSPAHFAREFKRCTQCTPHRFVMERRLDRARRMLAAASSIADTAAACGFSDQPHLTRLFKQRFGVTPARFVRTVVGPRRSS